ncbi:stage III sporulation protein AE [Gottschalkia acidurici 9a]|uniref:Stage III sporulation protein AE n=1 Tax=Gottschalkia acidurici (strain ATCC 7906 / DSM 604 / BCRC 14475 / CIP 104303 / KCTC 5404 / NCIMB 10678 / 9a) TaxID=1128398 RepID=K0B183_GOTA9|nr:stage III sporulation protein AE [Gottschalkia acidurici]AFS78386.1 stage III sporulation protein AE [Gottschalkia acidurici 9a]
MLKKMTMITVITLSILLSLTGIVHSEDEDGILDSLVKNQIENLNIDELEKVIEEINKNTSEFLPKMNLKEDILSMVKGEDSMDIKLLTKGLLKYLFKEIVLNWGILTKVLFLSIICSILTNMQGAFEGKTIGELSFYVCYLILVAMSINSLMVIIKVANEAIGSMVFLMQALLPILITLLLAIGGITSSSLFQPIILGSISVVSTLMKDVILPLIILSTIIGVISNISSKVQITKLSGFLRRSILYVIGISITLFMGVMSIRGAVGSKLDGLTIRTAKFAVDKFVPVVGRFLSDTMETVVGCSMLIKNAVGIFGLIALFIITIVPIIKIISLILIYKFTIVIIEPIANERIVNCLTDISKSLTLVLATVAIVGVLFFMAVTIVIGAGNATVMLR